MTNEEIFEQATKLSGRQRDEFLDQACGDDTNKRQRIDKLLQANENTNSLLDAVPSDDSLASTTEALSKGKHPVIGNYKLLHKLGEGGFGVVYMAEQTEPVRRKVALKIVRTERLGDATSTIARFEAERQALAMMDHPNIAKVFDGGAIPAGTDLLTETLGVADRPFFVMELVNGVPITDYCDKNKLPNRERLNLFVTVCHAVQHAHQKGVIHRDLKPSNILVTLHDGKPVVKVIDFGVAKAINQQLTDKTLYTVLGDMIGTPLYMSPEQAERSGLDIDTRSDIYSLGVLLYELLTGTTPLTTGELREAGILQIQKCILESEPPKPSTRLSTSGNELTVIAKHRSITPDKLSRELKGDLDWIVMKALEKDRSRRYDTAKGFANDIERFLNDDAVTARPPSALYTLRKLARRHRGVVATVGMVLGALVLGLLGVAVAWKVADDNRHKAEVARNEAIESNKRAEEANEELRIANYSFQIESAFAWERGSLGRLSSLLSSSVKDQDEHLPGFEWRLLKNFHDQNFPNHTYTLPGIPNDLCFSPSGESIVVALQNDGSLCVVNLAAGEVRAFATSLKSDDRIRGRPSIAFLADHRFVVGGVSNKEEDCGVLLECSMDQLERSVRIIDPHVYPRQIQGVMIHGEFIYCSTASENATWRVHKTSMILDADFEMVGVYPAAFENMLITHTVGYNWEQEHNFHIYEAATGELIEQIPTGVQPRGVTVSDDGRRLFLADSSGTWYQDIDESGRVLGDRRQLSWRRVGLQQFLGADLLLSAGSDDNSVTLQNAETGRLVKRLLHNRRVVGLAHSDDKRLVASVGRDRKLKVWEVARHTRRIRPGYPAFFAPFSVSDQRELLVHLSGPMSVDVVSLLDFSTRTLQIRSYVQDLHLSPDGSKLVIAARDRDVSFLTKTDDVDFVPLEFPGKAIGFLDESRIVVADTSSFSIFQYTKGALNKETRMESETQFGFCDFALDEGRELLALGSRTAGFVAVCDMSDPSSIKQYKSSTRLLALALDPQNGLLALAGESERVRVLDYESGKPVHDLQGNGYWLTSVAFSPDGKTLAAASPIGEIKFWRMPGGEEAGSITLEEGIRKIQFSDDGDRLYWSSMDGDVGYLQAAPVASFAEQLELRE